MKKEDKNKQRHAEQKEKLFTLDQVISLAQLITAGVMGIGGQECADEAMKLPDPLKAVLVSAILASRECMKDMVPSMLSSLVAKVAAKE